MKNLHFGKNIPEIILPSSFEIKMLKVFLKVIGCMLELIWCKK